MANTGERLDPSERDKEIAVALGMHLMATSAEAFDVLNKLYSQLRIGGGFFTGRKMSEEIGKQTRYEFIAYMSALTRILMETWQNPTGDVRPVLIALESIVFSLKLEKARPAYEDYIARYYGNRPTDSAVLEILGRELIVNTQFHHKLADIWNFVPSPSSSESSQFTQTLIALTQRIEGGLRALVNGIRL